MTDLALERIASWPNPDTATADQLARALTVRAYARSLWALANVDDSHAHSIAAESVQADLGLVETLMALSMVDEPAADTMARTVLHCWADGDARSWMWRRLVSYGIDPGDVERAVREPAL